MPGVLCGEGHTQGEGWEVGHMTEMFPHGQARLSGPRKGTDRKFGCLMQFCTTQNFECMAGQKPNARDWGGGSEAQRAIRPAFANLRPL
jgi:hypothetical protein